MGRPINKKYIGNVSNSGQQIQATGYFSQLGAAAPAYISAQKATNTYNFVSTDGQYAERLQLAPGGAALLPGQANIVVQPYGSTGSGATAVANLGVLSFTVVSGGTGSTDNGYAPGEILNVNGGTYTTNLQANALVTSVTLGAATVTSDTGYTVGDTFTWNYAGWSSPTVLTVASTSGNGNISGVTITNAGLSSNINVTNTTPYTSALTANAWASTAAFSLRWDVASLAVANIGDYTAPPSNPVSFLTTAYGTGATATALYEISSTEITNPGLDYQAAQVTVSGNGNAIIYATVNNTGNVSALSIAAHGSFGPTRPALTISPVASTEYAEVVRNLTVTTWDKNTYEWVDSTVVPVPGQAVLKTS